MRPCRYASAPPNATLVPDAAIFSAIIRHHLQMRRIGPVQPTSPETLLLAEFATVERVIRFISARRRLRPADAEDFASHVKMRLIENDYAVLRKFEGRSSLLTYLTVVVQRMYADYCAAAHGRWRPSAEARRAGEVGIVLERLLWRDGFSLDEACEILVTNHQVPVGRAELERIAALLPPRAKRQFESEASLDEHPAAAPGPEALVEHRERSDVARRISAELKRFVDEAEPQDRLILALRFADRRTVPEIAALLRLDQKWLYRRLDILLRQVRNALHAAGIDADEALAVFDDPAISVDVWDRSSVVPREVMVEKERPRERP
jgi:RNA polymerase sigma factor for flagellar operon FliA